jgi:hypothetical protein
MDELDLVECGGMVDRAAPVGAVCGRVRSLLDRGLRFSFGLFSCELASGGSPLPGFDACKLDLRLGNRLPLECCFDFEFELRDRLTCQAGRQEEGSKVLHDASTLVKGLRRKVVQVVSRPSIAQNRDTPEAVGMQTDDIANTAGEHLLFYFLIDSRRIPSSPLLGTLGLS